MELQIPHHPHTQIPQKDYLPADIKRYRVNHQDIMCPKGSRDYRSGSNAGSYPSLRGDSPKYAVSDFMGYLKGKSSLMIFDRHANLKYQYGNRHFWCRGYYVDTVGRNEKVIREYVRNQLQEDIATDQISLKEFKDPFTGEPVGKGK